MAKPEPHPQTTMKTKVTTDKLAIMKSKITKENETEIPTTSSNYIAAAQSTKGKLQVKRLMKRETVEISLVNVRRSSPRCLGLVVR